MRTGAGGSGEVALADLSEGQAGQGRSYPAGRGGPAADWFAEVNGTVHGEICAVPAGRLLTERELLTAAVAEPASGGGVGID
jgi:hypothetical protein